MASLTNDPIVDSILSESQDLFQRSSRDRFASAVARTRAWALGSDEKYNYLPLNPGESLGNFQTKPKGDRGVLELALQQYINGVTALPIKRWVPNYPSFSLSRYTKHLDPQKIQTATEISGTTAVRPVRIANGDISYEVFDALQLHPRVQAGVLVALGISYQLGKDTVLEVWTDYSQTYVVKGQVQWTAPNPYGQIPFAIFRAAKSDADWMGVSDLQKAVGMDIAISKMMTDVMELARDQSYSWPVYKGDLPEEGDEASGDKTPMEGLQMGPGRLITIPKDADFFTVSPQANIAEINQVINDFARAAFEKLSVMGIDKGSEYSSGFALQVKSSRYLQKVAGKRELYIESEEKLLELAVLVDEVGRIGAPGVLNEDFKVEVDIDADSLNPRTVQEDIELAKFLLDTKVWGAIELVQKTFGYNREEAILHLASVTPLPSTEAATAAK